jgi:aspartyl-tRNA(Asn)/glutamyl-tRNA(Gln) amidotransferase subunit A
MAGCVDDLKVMFRALSTPSDDTGDALLTSPPRIGLVDTYYLEQADPEVVAITRNAVARLQTAGAPVSAIKLPTSFSEVHARHLIVMACGAAIVHREQFAAHGDKYGREIGTLIRKGQAVDEATYLAALEHQQAFRKSMSDCFANVDVLVTPGTATPAPTADSTGDPKFNSPWSYSGLPTVCLPCGLSETGLPLSLQLIGPLGSDNQLLSIAAWMEPQLAFDRRPAICG